jgi:hypothetical protein
MKPEKNLSICIEAESTIIKRYRVMKDTVEYFGIKDKMKDENRKKFKWKNKRFTSSQLKKQERKIIFYKQKTLMMV